VTIGSFTTWASGLSAPPHQYTADYPHRDNVVRFAQLQTVAITRHHEVGFYTVDGHFLDDVTRFIRTALKAGSAAIVIATESHRESLLQGLQMYGIDMTLSCGHKATQRRRFSSKKPRRTTWIFCADIFWAAFRAECIATSFNESVQSIQRCIPCEEGSLYCPFRGGTSSITVLQPAACRVPCPDRRGMRTWTAVPPIGVD
jgi:hypothetical protein